MTKFIPGLQLSRLFYKEAVQPILKKNFPDLRYSAALIGWGSEVLGHDTAQSSDHHWGPRMLLFLNEVDYKKYKKQISEVLSDNLHLTFWGYSTNFSKAEANGVRHMVYKKSGKVNHMVDIFTLKSFLKRRLDVDSIRNLKVADWLAMPQQRLLEITSGEVFRDDIGVNEMRNGLKYYSRDIWLYLLASQWKKISQEEAFVGRTGDVGDELGSQVVASRLVRELMRLCFIMEKRYIPYTKWFGTGFKGLAVADKLNPIFRKIMFSRSWKERQRHLSQAYGIIGRKHNSLKITKLLSTKASRYYGRPYLVIHAGEFAAKIQQGIKDRKIRSLKLIGSVDQFTDSTDISENLPLAGKLKVVYL